MRENEVIIVKIADDIYKRIVRSAVDYAILSLPFTIDRMKIPNEEQRALNIAKGKIAEYLFQYYCVQNRIPADFKSCTTPFYQIDKKDFILNGREWDIKNNFIYYEGDKFPHPYTHLPALVPNRHKKDQWSQKETANYLFTFIKGAELKAGKRIKEFLNLKMNQKQQDFLRELYDTFHGLPQKAQPFEKGWFQKEYKVLGTHPLFELNFRPNLIITGFANPHSYDLFENCGPNEADNLVNDPIPNWYAKKGKRNSLKFLDGVIWTTIKNATVPVEKLEAFSAII